MQVPEFRIALTLPGAISLGAYEGGALAAFLVAVQRVKREAPDALRIDAIAGASAGSITAVLAARTVLEGLDPIDVMWRAWVTSPSLDTMRAKGFAAPLSLDRVRRETTNLLSLPGDPKVAQRTPVHLNLALGVLRGLEYPIGRLGGPPLPATTYLDWGERRLEHGLPPLSYEEPLEASIIAFAHASGASPAAFSPVRIDRSADEAEYRRNGVTNFPDSGWLWYTDGGTLDNEPLGRALGLSNEIDGADAGDHERLHLLISPAPETPARADDQDIWSDPDRAPSWSDTAARTLTLLRAQNLFEDLKRVEKTNTRLDWIGQLEDTLIALLEGPGGGAEQALQATIDAMEAQKRDLPTDADTRAERPESPETDLRRRIREALELASGLRGKRRVGVDIVSPLLLPEVRAGGKVAEVLAGDIVEHFGGFLDERYRSNDFAAGYRSMLEWMGSDDRGLVHQGLPADRASAAVAAARELYRESWETGIGGQTYARLPATQKWRLFGVLKRMGLVAIADRLRRRRS